MKKSIFLVSLLTISSLAMARDIEYFVSVGGGKSSVNIKGDVKRNSDGVTRSTMISNDYGFVSIQGGVLLESTHKIGLDYTKYNTSNDTSMYSISLGYDYLFSINNSALKPFLGLAYSLNKYSEDLQNSPGMTWDTSSADLTTNALFARVGIKYDFNKNFFVLASYDYALSVSGDASVGIVTSSGVRYTQTVEIDKLSRFGAYIGYKF